MFKRVFGARDADAAARSAHGKYREGPAFPPGELHAFTLQGVNLGVFTDQRSGEALLSGIGQRLQVCKQVIQPSAQRAAEKHFVIAVLRRIADGQHGVGVVFFGGIFCQRD